MNPDQRATRLLLGSLLDWVPGARTSTGQIVARGALPGEADTAKRDCPSCAGAGARRRRGMWIGCERCAGRGTLKVDGYTQREIAGEGDLDRPGALLDSIRAELALEDELSAPEAGTAGTARARRKAAQDAIVARLEALYVERAVDEAGPVDPFTIAWEARERQYAAGDYADLERLLGSRRLRDGRAYTALMVVFVLDPLEPGFRRIGPLLRQRADAELPPISHTLRTELGRPIRVPGWVRAADERERDDPPRASRWYRKRATDRLERSQRDELIQAMTAAGRSCPEIATRTGLTRRRVEQIVAAQEAAA